MRISSITTNTGHPNSVMKWSAPLREKRYAQNNNEKNEINTTIKRTSDGRASFKGGVPLLHRAANFTSDFPLVAEALFALLITCGLRPICIMATAKNEEDKEKCSYQAAKSIASGLVGLAMTAIVGTTIAMATKSANNKGAFKMPEELKAQSRELVDKGLTALTDLGKQLTESGQEPELVQQISALTDGGKLNIGAFKKFGKNALKLFTQNIKRTAPDASDTVINAINAQKTLNNYERTGKNVMDKFFQPIFMPLRAKITVALIPPILGIFGLHKAGSKPKNKEIQQNALSTLNLAVFQSDSAKELFKDITGGNK